MIRSFLLFVILTLFSVVSFAVESRLVDSRALAQAYSQQLQAELQQALSSGGPSNAITVCRDFAPTLASELSRASGAKVTRVSRRYRNPEAAPENWQTKVLMDFQSRAADLNQGLEYFNQDQNGARYMAAIQLKPLCLTCHGATLSKGVKRQLAADYPHDQATGYEVGDLRGAFSVSWPVTTEDTE